MAAASANQATTWRMPSMSSPTSLAYPTTRSRSPPPPPSTSARSASSRAESARWSSSVRAAPSLRSRGTKTRLDRASTDTSDPGSPARRTFRRRASTAAAEPSQSSGMTGPPRNPSSVTSVHRTAGIQSDFTQADRRRA